MDATLTALVQELIDLNIKLAALTKKYIELKNEVAATEKESNE